MRKVYRIDTHPIKTFLASVAFVMLVQLLKLVSTMIPPKKAEQFTDDTLRDCQIQIDLDRKRLLEEQQNEGDEDNDAEITTTLNKISNLSQSLEDFLRVNKPDTATASAQSLKIPN
jgi:hypothetical protein